MINNKRLCLLVFMIVISLFCLTGCFTKTPITGEDFKNKMEEKGYTVVDGLAEKEEESGDEDTASFISSTLIEAFKGTSGGYATVSGLNYEKGSKNYDSGYIVVSRIEDTVIIAETKKDHKKEVDSIIDMLGY